MRRIPKSVQARAQHILNRLRQGEDWRVFHGKRLTRDRSLVSIPIGQHWRLVVRALPGKIESLSLLSHADYNHYIR